MTDTPQPKWQLARLVPSQTYPEFPDQGRLLWVDPQRPKIPEDEGPLFDYSGAPNHDPDELCVHTAYVYLRGLGAGQRTEVPAEILERYPIFRFDDPPQRVFEIWRARGGEPESLLDGQETATRH